MSSPFRKHERSLSPLKSPTMRRHLLMSDDVDIHYPEQFLPERRHIYKQSLIGDDGHFRAALDVHDFDISEITVKAIGHTIIVTCAHEEKEDEHGAIIRNFTKKFILPLDLDIDAIETKISKGVLYIKVPPKSPSDPQVRTINIKLE